MDTHPTSPLPAPRIVDLGHIRYFVTAEALDASVVDLRQFVEAEVRRRVSAAAGPEVGIPLLWEVRRRHADGRPSAYVCRPSMAAVKVIDALPKPTYCEE